MTDTIPKSPGHVNTLLRLLHLYFAGTLGRLLAFDITHRGGILTALPLTLTRPAI
jgi:hypothetical protein